MANIFWITCPKCKKRFYAELSMLRIKTQYHCPYCDVYFEKADIRELKEGK
jgi:hypothetical protein